MYNIEVPEIKEDNQRYIGIDIGVNNLATVCNNIGDKAFMINGKPLKSVNQYYNKQISHYREVTKRMGDILPPPTLRLEVGASRSSTATCTVSAS